MKKIKSVREYSLPTDREYVVQYEIEFEDRDSINDIAIVKGNSEFDAMTSFDNDKELQDRILADYRYALKDSPTINVSANACWPAEEMDD
jgi:hypothetical protein